MFISSKIAMYLLKSSGGCKGTGACRRWDCSEQKRVPPQQRASELLFWPSWQATQPPRQCASDCRSWCWGRGLRKPARGPPRMHGTGLTAVHDAAAKWASPKPTLPAASLVERAFFLSGAKASHQLKRELCKCNSLVELRPEKMHSLDDRT